MAREHWDANVGRFARDPEAARAASKKGNAVKKAKAEFRKMVGDMSELRTDAIAHLLQEDPNMFKHLMDVVKEQAMAGEKWAIEMLIGQTGATGFAAPRKTENTIKEEPMSKEEALKILGVDDNGEH